MWHQLRRDGVTGHAGRLVARCTVERLMRGLRLRGVRRGRPVITTRPDGQAGRATNPAFVSDVYSRRIVGWRCAARMPTELPLDALEMALWTRELAGQTTDGRLDGLIHHSDTGSQYTAIRYGDRLAEAGALASIGSVGDSSDNASTNRSLTKLAAYLAEHHRLPVSAETVRRVLREAGIRWQATKTWKASRDPDFTANMNRILALYGHPPTDRASDLR